MKIRVLTGFLLCGILLFSASAVHALSYEDWLGSVVTAGDAMLEAQNDNGSFDWRQNNDYTDSGAANTQGATGRGLVAAYLVTGDSKYLDGANEVATFIINNTSGLYNKDIEFLFELADAGGDDHTTFATTQAVNYINDKVSNYDSGTSGAQAIYNRYEDVAWAGTADEIDGLKLWMIGEWGHVGQLIGDTEIYTGYTGLDLAAETGTLLNDVFSTWDPETDNTLNYAGDTLGLVGILEGLAFGGLDYSNEEAVIQALLDNETTGWQDTAYKTYALSLFNINQPEQLSAWIDAGYFDTTTEGAYLESMGEALLGVASAPVPEPTTMLLFGLGLLGVAGISRSKAVS